EEDPVATDECRVVLADVRLPEPVWRRGHEVDSHRRARVDADQNDVIAGGGVLCDNRCDELREPPAVAAVERRVELLAHAPEPAGASERALPARLLAAHVAALARKVD